MKRKHAIVQLIILSFITVGCLITPAIGETKTVVFAIDLRDNFPITGKPGTETNKFPGIFIEQVNFIEKQTNIKVTYKRAPWKRCMINLKNGVVDGVICGSYKKERELNGVFPKDKDGKPDQSRRFSDSSYYLYVKQDSNINWDGNSFSNLNGTIGAQLGFSIVPFLENLGVKVSEVSSANINFKKMAKNRIAGIAAHEANGDALMGQFGGIKKIPTPLRSKAYYLIMSKQIKQSDPALVESIWQACADMQKEHIKTIKAKYIGKKNWDELK